MEIENITGVIIFIWIAIVGILAFNYHTIRINNSLDRRIDFLYQRICELEKLVKKYEN
jgi:hypothetical protein